MQILTDQSSASYSVLRINVTIYIAVTACYTIMMVRLRELTMEEVSNVQSEVLYVPI